eukprot:TRINITY_DN31365_c0_g1_i1.p1 TRINITY_DN31365_c0_g1~~TRINITY_DN31365_c0_g1_i1.p1  ORF type:complete len:339 (+),score=94.58 TRINITY_DN31365_c0_g1_i1:31-1017(+)
MGRFHGARNKKIMNLASAYNKDSFNQVIDSWQGHKQNVAEVLAGGPLRAKHVIHKLSDERDINKTSVNPFYLHQKVKSMFGHARAKRTLFEKEIMDEVNFKEQNTRVNSQRKRSDMPLLDENPYSNGYDYRMGADTAILDLKPILASKIHFATDIEIEKCLRWLHTKYFTVGRFANAVMKDYQGGTVVKLLDTYGDVYRHVELLSRLIISQEALRKSIVEKNRKQKLTHQYGGRIYALPGCYRISRKAPHHVPPTEIPEDPSSYGPWKWYESDFGTDIARLKRTMETRVPVNDPSVMIGDKQEMVRAGLHGGRTRAKHSASWRMSGAT